MSTPRPLWLRWLLRVALALAALAIAGFVWLFFLGGIAISDRAMLWRMIRGESVPAPTAEVIANQLRAAPGFEVGLFATDLPSARLMVVASGGQILLSQPRGGLVTGLEPDRDGDGRADGRRALFSGLDRPNGLDIHEGYLYVAEATRIFRVAFDTESATVTGPQQVIVDGLTADGSHWRKTARIGPDGWLYVGQGSTCNVCVEADSRRATVMRWPREGGEAEVVATGTRNPYGFDWAPWDQSLYATENGRDLLGDDLPPDELNRIVPGGFYGWPLRHGRDIVDPDFGSTTDPRLARAIAPAHEFGAHTAPLGMRFLRHPARPAGYERTALVALHGSWNRSTPAGYAVVALDFADDGRITERPFLDGFRGAAGLIGRPVDVVEAGDGAIYVSDDYAGVIYRVRAAPSSSSDG
ncbi:MAG: PQQ-dependent sugar dehydrogenase [Steroidobacteraceae bacterium]